MTGGRWGSLTDVPGISVGHAQRIGDGWRTGVTVVVPPPGTTGAVDVRGGGPATHETDALAPSTLTGQVSAICLTGGSAYGLAAVAGVMRWCEEAGIGFPVSTPGSTPGGRPAVVPIVPAAAIFDLGRGGDPAARPGPDLGYAAAQATRGSVVGGSPAPNGPVGAGTGAAIARIALAGGIGQASVTLPLPGVTVTVGALVVLNAAGSPIDLADGGLLGRAFVPPGIPRPTVPAEPEADALREYLTAHAERRARSRPSGTRQNTTLAVVATDARLDTAATWRTAASGHDGLARSLRPVHTLYDGDTVFALATGAVPLPDGVAGTAALVALQAAAADAVLLAVLDAVLGTTAWTSTDTPAGAGLTIPAYTTLCPSAQAPSR